MSQRSLDFRIPRAVASEMSPAVRELFDRLLEQIDRLSVEVLELKLENQRLRLENQQLRQENAELREQLTGQKTPQNSSLPPSTQHPHSKPARREPASGKKRGGQPGHPRHQRPLIPSDQCQDVVKLIPQQCRHCQNPLSGMDAEPLRHQVWEMPEIKPLVTEYQQHRLDCPHCGKTTCAPLPADVPTCQAGPRLMAFTSLLMAYFRQSKKRAALFLQAILNQPSSAAWLVKLQNRVTTIMRPPYHQLAAALPAESVLSGDETPTKEANQKAWLWTFVARNFTVFTVRPNRKGITVRDLLGAAYPGVITCDRARMYFQVGRVQWCWAHLKRDFQAWIDSPDGEAKQHGQELMEQTGKLFNLWKQYRKDEISYAELKVRMQPVSKEIEALLSWGVHCGNTRLAPTCRQLWEYRERLWVYLDVEGVEPTNNRSERALRHAVIWRKLSFGTQSAAGSRFVETMLSIIETCRQQGRNVLAYVTESIQNHLSGQSVPMLL